MSGIYNRYALQLGDDDLAFRYGGAIRTPSEVGAGNHVRALRDDLVELGFFLASESDVSKAPTFDRWLEEAVREFQVMARLPTVAQERAEPVGGHNYLRRLEPVNVDITDRYPMPDSGLPDRHASGVVNETTRRLIELWKSKNWRNPWVMAEWSVPAKPKKSLKPRAPAAPPATGNVYKVGVRTLKRHDLTMAGRTPKVNGEVYLHDFAGCYFADTRPEEPDPRYYLGTEVSYGTRRGPGAWRGLPDTVARLIKVTPETLTGSDIEDLDSPAASTFRVIGSVASVEVSRGLQMVNAYDLASLSSGLFHFALVSPDRKHPRHVGKGELGGLLAWLEKNSPEQFRNHVGHFGLRPEIVWADDGAALLNTVSGIWETFSCRESIDNDRGVRVDVRTEADVAQSWQWLARMNMLAFVSPAYREANWVLTRMRLQRIGTLPIGGTYPASWTLGAVFSSERLMAKLLRIHVQGSMRLATQPATASSPVCKQWIRDLLKKAALTAQEVAAGPAKWNEAVLARIEASLDKRYAGRYGDRKDKNGRTVKGDFTRIAEWTWKDRPVSTVPRSFHFQLAADDV